MKHILFISTFFIVFDAFTQTNTFPVSGNVGIGTIAPEYKLDIAGGHVRLTQDYSSTFLNGVQLRGYPNRHLWAIGNNPTTEFVIGSAWDWDQQIGIQYTPGSIALGGGNLIIGQTTKNSLAYTHGNTALYTNGLERFKINKDGNIGIGTSAPEYKLDITGGHVRLTQDFSSTFLNGVQLRGYPNRYLWAIGNNPTTEFVIGSAWDWDQQIGIQYTPGSIAMGDGNLIIGQTNKNSSTYTHGNTALYTNGIERLKINKDGNVGIGTIAPTEKLSVNGNIRAKKLIVSQQNWSDYVFYKGYKLRPLLEVEKYIQQYQHLPEVPSAKEVQANGISVGDTQALLLKKIEELTLYMIQLTKENEKAIKKIEILDEKIKTLKYKPASL